MMLKASSSATWSSDFSSAYDEKMKLQSWLLAQSYDWLLRKTEQRCFGPWRQELLLQARGELLEIGAGTGANLPFYPQGLSGITLSEPDPQMRRRLENKLNDPSGNRLLAPWSAEQIERPDQSFDTIVSSLVLCSVQDQPQALSELYRLLRPGGQLLFLEHIVASDEKTRKRQKMFEPLWRCCSGNCHLTRDTLAEIEKSGLQIVNLQEDEIVGAPAILRRAVRGVARKPMDN